MELLGLEDLTPRQIEQGHRAELRWCQDSARLFLGLLWGEGRQQEGGQRIPDEESVSEAPGFTDDSS